MASARRDGETDHKYFDRIEDEFRPPDRSIAITAMWNDGPRDLYLARIVLRPDGEVDARRLRGKRLIFKLKPAPVDGEHRWRLIERAVQACIAVEGDED